MKNDLQIAVLGLGHTGCVYTASLANLGYRVTAFDLDNKLLDDLQKGISPINEPEFSLIIKKNLGKNITFSRNIDQVLKDQKYTFLTQDLVVDEKNNIDLTNFNKLIKLLKLHLPKSSTLIISSQVPVGTSRKIAQRVQGKHIKLIYFAENLRLGDGFNTFLNPDRIVLGSDSTSAINQFTLDFPFFNCPALKMSLESAEMAKHALNSFLALNISFASEMADLCEALGANYLDVVSALKTDHRVSKFAPINPGLGFGGGSLGRDVLTLINLSKKSKYQPKILKSILDVNEQRINHIISRIERIIPKLKQKQIGILGLTFKPTSNIINRSMSVMLAKALHKKGALIRAFDPKVKKTIDTDRYINICQDEADFFKNLDLTILMTPHGEFRKINPKLIAKLMRTKIIFDSCSFLNRQSYVSLGFKFYATGLGESA